MNNNKLVNIKGFECYYIGEENGYKKYLCKDCLTEKQIAKYGDGDELMIYGNEVRFQDNIRNRDFDKSYIKSVILDNMAKDLGFEVSLLSKEEAEDLDIELRKSDNYYWTKSYNESPAWFVFYTGGDLIASYSGLTISFAVRPVFYLKSEIIEEPKKIEKIDEYDELEDILSYNDYSLIKNSLHEILTTLKIKQNEIIDVLNERGKDE